MPRWLLIVLLLVQAHFCASYLVPLDEEGQQTFGGLLRWAWPWADGDHGPLGSVTTSSGFPVAGFFVAVTAAALFLGSALAVLGWWVPLGWWRGLAAVGAVLSLVLMLLFLSPTKVVPILGDLLVLALVVRWVPAAVAS